MKLDLLVSSLKGGGAERVAGNLASAFARRGHEVRLLVTDTEGEADYRPDAAVAVEWISAGRVWGPRALRPLWRILQLGQVLRARRADLVIAIQANMAIETALATLGSGLRVVGCEHNIPSRSVRGWLWAALRPAAYRRLAAVVTLTRGAAAELAPLCGNAPLRVIPNALHMPLPAASPVLPPDTIVPPDVPLVLAVGRLVPAKGFDLLLTRFEALHRLAPDARLVILGDGPERAALTETAAVLGLGSVLAMPGRAGNMEDWYQRADLLVMTSRWEGLPMVLLEAMGHGLVPVVTDFDHGPRDIIRPGIDGEILADGTVDLWAETVARLLADAGRRAALSVRAPEIALRFGEAEVMRAWAALFDELDAGGPANRA